MAVCPAPPADKIAQVGKTTAGKDATDGKAKTGQVRHMKFTDYFPCFSFPLLCFTSAFVSPDLLVTLSCGRDSLF